MSLPAARLTDLDDLGDVIVGPGEPSVLFSGLPASCLGDAVAGAMCEGSIVDGSLTVLAGGRPVARMTSAIVGVNPDIGVPVASVVLGPCDPTVLV